MKYCNRLYLLLKEASKTFYVSILNLSMLICLCLVIIVAISIIETNFSMYTDFRFLGKFLVSWLLIDVFYKRVRL